jgi:hypothetical protein
MNGYWYGTYSGSNTGTIVVELDERGDHFEGCAYAYDNNHAMPNTFALIVTPTKEAKQKFTAPLLPLHPETAGTNELEPDRGSISRRSCSNPSRD